MTSNKNEILKAYKNRLINFSSKNRTIYLPKIYKKRSLDMKRLDKSIKNLSKNIYNFLLDHTKSELVLCPNYMSVQLTEDEKKELEPKIKFENGIPTKVQYDILYKKALTEKKEKLMLIYKDIATLQNEILAQIHEKGQNNLYIGFPFLEGTLIDKSLIRCPIFLFPMKLEKKETGWFLIKRKDSPILFNKSFYLAYKTIHGGNIDELEEEFDSIKDILKIYPNIFEATKKILENINISINSSMKIDPEILEMKDCLKEELLKTYPNPELRIKNYLILGDFSISQNSLYKDYEYLISNKEKTLIDEILFSQPLEKENFENLNKEEVHIEEKDCHFITELDYSQEKAIKLIDKKGNLVIYGPPGTGKSQVIANLISDNLAKGKKILVVSEKRTALDVVYKRLESCNLSQRLAFVHDSKTDRITLFEKINKIIKEVKIKKDTKYSFEIDNFSREIQSKLNRLDELAAKIHLKGKNGLSLFELYLKSNSKIPQNNFIKYNFNLFKNLNYYDLKKCFSQLAKLCNNLQFDLNDNPYISNRASFSKNTEIDLNHFKQQLKKIKCRDYSIEFFKIIEEFKKNIEKYEKEKIFEFKENKKFIINQTINMIQKNLETKEKELNSNFYKVKDDIMSLIGPLIQNKEQKLEEINLYKMEVEKIDKFFSKDIFLNLDIIYENIQLVQRMCFLNPKKYILQANIQKQLNSKISFEKEKIEKWVTLKKLSNNIFENLDYKEIKSFYLAEINNFQEKIKLEKEALSEVGTKLDIIASIDDILNIEIKFDFSNLELNTLKNIIIEINNFKNEKKSLENFNNFDQNIINLKFENNLEIYNKQKEKFIQIIEEETLLKSQLNYLKSNLAQSNNFSFENLKEISCKFEKIQLQDAEIIYNSIYKIIDYIKQIENDFQEIENLKSFINPKGLKILKNNIFHNKDFYLISDLINILEVNSSNLISHDSIKDNLSTEATIIYEYILKEQITHPIKEYLTTLKNSFYLEWINIELQNNRNIILEINNYDSLKNDIINLMEKKKKLIPNFIINILDSKIKNRFLFTLNGEEQHYKSFLIEVNKKRKILPLRKFVKLFANEGLFDLLPCWLLSPDMVSEIIPFEIGLFDIVIFDEASQILIEKAIPSIFRGKSVVIAGDDKQLQPTTIGIKSINSSDNNIDQEEEEIEEYIEYNDNCALDEKSLLDVAKLRFSSSNLTFHYRSKYEELINFSNYAFYKGELQTSPNISDNLGEPPIKRILVDGIWENKKNVKEAEEIYILLKNIFKNREENESIGIITFNLGQQNFIREYLDEKSMEDTEFKVFYSKEKERYDDTEDKSLFIKNIENVQGDERDIIIFSIGYARNPLGKVVLQFGTLNQKGGENRLNVAISRAKKKIYVVTSIEPEELLISNTKNEGPKLLKKYLQYVRAISNNEKELAKTILNSLSIKEKSAVHCDIFDSPFEEQVCEALRNKNLEFEVHTQVGDSGYKIDLGIFNPKKSEYVLGIECDGATYHSTPNARERDIYRQKFLENKGWKIHRIWSRDWWNNPTYEIEKILKKLPR